LNHTQFRRAYNQLMLIIN